MTAAGRRRAAASTATPPNSAPGRAFTRFEWTVGAGWVLLVVLQAGVNAESAISDALRRGQVLPAWEPWTWELTSALCSLALTPAVIFACRQLPLWGPHRLRNGFVLLLLSPVFSVLHVVAMVGLRELVYAGAGSRYDFGDWPRELLYEYRKDFITYCLIVAGSHWLLHRRDVAPPKATSPEQGVPPEPYLSRLLVPDRFRERVVAVDDIRWIEADGNYVRLHTSEGSFRPRMTLSYLEQRLDPGRFARIHRSYLVNLGAVAEVQPWFHGDFRILLQSGETLPLSRRFRDRLKER